MKQHGEQWGGVEDGWRAIERGRGRGRVSMRCKGGQRGAGGGRRQESNWITSTSTYSWKQSGREGAGQPKELAW